MKEIADCDRLNRRLTVLLHGRCRQSSWQVFDVELGDISEGGCCVIGNADRFAQGQHVSLRFANLRNVEGSVRWLRDDRIGLEFRKPIKARVIEELAASFGLPETRLALAGNAQVESGLGSTLTVSKR